MPTRENTLRRRIRSTGGKLLRRYGLLPGGMPDGLGDDEKLSGETLAGEIVVYFPDTADSLYQLRGWYGPLLELHRAQGITVICADSRAAAIIRQELPVPVITIAQDATLDAILLRSDTKLILYINYNPLNTAALRTRSALHVSLLHGDSDKGVSVSNQVKAYDFSFVAGQAAIDRFTRYTALFDAEQRCLPVGRPSLDTEPRSEHPQRQPDAPPVVLYAPTWEGGQSSVAYSSLLTHGEAILRSLTGAGMKVIYRPHPLTGVRVPEYGETDRRLRSLSEEIDLAQVSDGQALWADFSRADLLICDVSAVTGDWLAAGRPLLVTRSAEGGSRDATTELLRTVRRLGADEAEDTGRIAREQIDEDPQGAQRLALTEYYLGDTSPGASLARFLTACRDLSARRDELWARIRGNQEGQRSPAHRPPKMAGPKPVPPQD
ncbi:MAG: CDP-glycerol glycerophosphotransferase family protein [Brachybacterium sp.]|nr:CDP-glycerol glycerophosphotransferase family protein [Brachybacterium sp.]